MTTHTTFINKKGLIIPVKIIELKEVGKQFGRHRILEDVNLTVQEGDVLGVIGQSGCGKSTLLNLITGFLEPSNGELTYFPGATSNPLDLNKHLHKIKKHIGFTPQHNSFYPKLTVEENLHHFGKLYQVKKNILQDNINNLLEITKLKGHKNKLAEHLSGGMQKRLDLSCSLVHKPKLLVLDEPTADLDPVLQNEMVQFLKEINQMGITIVIASHNLEGLEKICNKIAIVHNGKVHSQGLIEEIKKPFLKDHFTINIHPGESKEKLLKYLKSMPIKKIVDQGTKVIIYPKNTEITIKNILDVIKQENLFLHDMDFRKPTLVEIFERTIKK